MAKSGLLNTEALRRRKRSNNLNIKTTFWAWMVEVLTNMILYSYIRFFFGKDKFLHGLFAIISASLNFNILPFFFIAVSDDEIKEALSEKKFITLLRLMLQI